MQAKTATVTINSVMREAAFQQGVRDYWRRAPIPGNLPQQAQETYERGRLFAAASGAKLIHISRGKVCDEQRRAFAKLYKERIIL